MQMLTMAKIVWAFDITSTQPVDTSMETAFTNGFVVAPKEYPAKFIPRSQDHVRVVEEEALKAEEFLKRFD
jgi:hypothetical protein